MWGYFIGHGGRMFKTIQMFLISPGYLENIPKKRIVLPTQYGIRIAASGGMSLCLVIINRLMTGFYANMLKCLQMQVLMQSSLTVQIASGPGKHLIRNC